LKGSPSSPPPVALTVAGSDSSAGAGIQADLKAFAAHGVYGVNALTAIVAEAPDEVTHLEPVDSTLLTGQLDRVDSRFPLAAAKTGMLGTASNVAAVVEFLQSRRELPCIVDPVIRAGTGAPLLTTDGIEALRERLLPLAALVTPNLPEAEMLLQRELRGGDAIAEAARELHERCGCDALIKGGHVEEGGEVVDRACLDGELVEFRRPRLEAPDLHGTGCTLSAAIAARLAQGASLPDAIDGAAAYLADAIASHWRWPDPAGSEALNHFPDGVDFPEP